jgi:hypothetical protein
VAAANLENLRAVARRLVEGVFEVLRAEHVLPTPTFHSYIKVGRDYFGDSVRAVPEHVAFSDLLTQLYPERFEKGDEPFPPEYAEMYAYDLVEAAAARCGRAGTLDQPAEDLDASIDELIAVLDASTRELVCCRVVSHLTTSTREPLALAGIEVVPEVEPDAVGVRGHDEILGRIVREIPRTPFELNRETPFPWDRPHALLIARETLPAFTSFRDRVAGTPTLSPRIDRFLLLLRLLTAATTESFYELEGPSTLIAAQPARFTNFERGWFGSRVRRTVRLDDRHRAAFEALGRMIDEAGVQREGMASIALDAAFGRFSASFTIDNEFERIVSLATALEATLSGEKDDSEALTFKLRSRCAALLATERDSARALFEDVGALYSIRSAIVHGGAMKQKELRKLIAGISTIEDGLVETQFGVAAGHAADRMREIVRRAILARLCLAEAPDPLWPLHRSWPVDAILADDATRTAWRESWHQRLEELGAGESAQPAELARHFLDPDDRA